MNGRAMFGPATIVLCLAVAPLAAQSGNELFQQALTKERAEGNLQDAISIYQRILRDYSKDRPLAARALVQLGKAYERRGERDARAAYERVVREFGDQQSAVSEARDRLVALAPDGTPATPRVASARMLLRSDALNGSLVTDDGRFLVFVDSTGNLATRDLRSGLVAQITRSTSNWDEFADRLSASPDGQVFAYAWWNGPRLIWELRTIDRRGGAERTLVSDSNIGYTHPYGFSPDGRSVLVTISPEGKQSELTLIDVRTGTRTPLKPIRGSDPVNAAVSPDGRFIVYDEVVDTASGARDIRILTIATKADTVLVRHPASDYAPMWGPGGDGVFFVSTRIGSDAGWYVPVRAGRSAGIPVLVRPDLGRGSRLGLTRDGMLYYTPSNAARSDVYLAEIDLASGSVVKAPTILETKTTGSNSAPSWSRDGKFLVYVAGPTAEQGIRLRSVETGVETEFHVQAVRVDLTPDNRFVIASYLDRTRAMVGLLRIDVSSGAIDTIARKSGVAMNFPVASADGRSVYYILTEQGRGHIVERNLQTGAERSIDPIPSPSVGLAVSPDGRWIATLVEDRSNGFAKQRVKLVPITPEYGSPRELAPLDHGGATLSWTPDGKSLVVLTNDGSKKEFWLVPTDGSNPRRLTSSFGKNVARAQLSPDGRHVALRIDDYTSELWVARNFLPSSAGVRR